MKNSVKDEVMDGKAIKRLRIERDLSQQELGRRVNLSQSAIANIENEVCLQSRKGVSIAKALGVTTESLYKRDNSELSTAKSGKDYSGRFNLMREIFPDWKDILQNVSNYA